MALCIREGGAVCDAVSNGYRKTRQDFDDMACVGLRSIGLSIDGFGETHNAIRGRADAFSEAERFCAALKQTGVALTAVTTITRPGLADLERLCGWMLEQGVEIWQWQQVSPMGRAAGQSRLCLDGGDILHVMKLYQSLRRRMPILLADNLGYYASAPDGGTIHPFSGCGAGLSVIGLDSRGNVRGCESLYDSRFIEGNIRERSLRGIWEDPNAFAYNRRFRPSDLTGACAVCRHGRRCAGGCRSFNAFHESLYEHVNCAYRFSALDR